jgi:ASC-1-like (ASCH) protein
MVKKEVFEWVKSGQKTVEVGRGNARKGEEAVFQCGSNLLRLQIARKETGRLAEIVRRDNFKAIIPSADSIEEATGYLQSLYGTTEGAFAAYYLKTG